MKRVSFCKYFLILALVVAPPAHAGRGHYHHHDDSGIFQTIAAVGIIAAAGYGIYKLCDWLFSKTDEQVLDEAKNCFTQAHAANARSVEMIRAGFGAFPKTKQEQLNAIRHVGEDFLYQCAIAHMHEHGRQFSVYESQVASALSMVQDRINYVKKKQLICPILGQLETAATDLAQLRLELAFCADFMREHASYFDLFDAEAKYMATYEFELSSPVREALRMAVMKKGAGSRCSYPYMSYVDTLERDIKNLNHQIARLSYNYHNRISAARLLLDRLNLIYNLVISEDAYRQELRDYKKEMLERERIAAEKAKAEAAAAHAYAAQQQAYAMQQQAHEMHRHNHLQAEANHIAACNPQETHVHVYT